LLPRCRIKIAYSVTRSRDLKRNKKKRKEKKRKEKKRKEIALSFDRRLNRLRCSGHASPEIAAELKEEKKCLP